VLRPAAPARPPLHLCLWWPRWSRRRVTIGTGAAGRSARASGRQRPAWSADNLTVGACALQPRRPGACMRALHTQYCTSVAADEGVWESAIPPPMMQDAERARPPPSLLSLQASLWVHAAMTACRAPRRARVESRLCAHAHARTHSLHPPTHPHPNHHEVGFLQGRARGLARGQHEGAAPSGLVAGEPLLEQVLLQPCMGVMWRCACCC